MVVLGLLFCFQVLVSGGWGACFLLHCLLQLFLAMDLVMLFSRFCFAFFLYFFGFFFALCFHFFRFFFAFFLQFLEVFAKKVQTGKGNG